MRVIAKLATEIKIGVKYYCGGLIWVGVRSNVYPDRVYLRSSISCKAVRFTKMGKLSWYSIGYRDRKCLIHPNWSWSIPKKVYELIDQ